MAEATLTPAGCASGGLTLAGAAGPLEALLDCPEGAPRAVALVLHPHPLYGGTMRNKVAHTLARTLAGLGAATLRFNFRGVGASAGPHDHGRGEAEDAARAAAWLRAALPGRPLWLAGFSFGAWVALRAAPVVRPDCLVTVAPPADRYDQAEVTRPDCPWLLVQGDADEVVDAAAVLRWARRMMPPPHIVRLPGTGHFFDRRLVALAAAVREGLAAAGCATQAPAR